VRVLIKVARSQANHPSVVFCGLLVLVFLAGLVKVFFDRRKSVTICLGQSIHNLHLYRLKKVAKKEELEAGPKEDTVELTQREKDEGDLFGIRAIEAGFYAGVAQSRPASRAGSVVNFPSMSTSTLVGGNMNSPLMKGYSSNTSIRSLHLGQNDSQRNSPPPVPKLGPSEAELTGKHGAVGTSRQATSTFGGSDDGFSDGVNTPHSFSRRSSYFQSHHYAPSPTMPMPEALQATYHDVEDNTRSQTASMNSSPGSSPPLPHPGAPPASRLPTLPATAKRRQSRSLSPESNHPRVRAEQFGR
jgi:hypothetical protein